MANDIFHKDPEILNGTAVFFPSVPVTREQATKLLEQALHQLTSGNEAAA